MKSTQTDEKTDGRTYGRPTTVNQKSQLRCCKTNRVKKHVLFIHEFSFLLINYCVIPCIPREKGRVFVSLNKKILLPKNT